MHGMPKGALKLSEYDLSWPSIFEKEKERIERTLENHNYTIEHIGSTSVPGLLAKPVIDISIEFETPNDLWHLVTKIKILGYEFRGPHDDEDHWYSVYNSDGKRLYHLHIFAKNSKALKIHLAFRNALRKDPKIIADYAKKKKEWAEQANWNKLEYSLSKESFIESVLNKR